MQAKHYSTKSNAIRAGKAQFGVNNFTVNQEAEGWKVVEYSRPADQAEANVVDACLAALNSSKEPRIINPIELAIVEANLPADVVAAIKAQVNEAAPLPLANIDYAEVETRLAATMSTEQRIACEAGEFPINKELLEKGEKLLAEAEKILKPARTPKILQTHESTIKRPCKRVWHIADEMPGATRKEVIARCVAEGIAYYTARTQYQQWLTVKRACEGSK